MEFKPRRKRKTDCRMRQPIAHPPPDCGRSSLGGRWARTWARGAAGSTCHRAGKLRSKQKINKNKLKDQINKQKRRKNSNLEVEGAVDSVLLGTVNGREVLGAGQSVGTVIVEPLTHRFCKAITLKLAQK